MIIPEDYDLHIHFKHEQFIFSFFEKVQKEEDIESLFPIYLGFARDVKMQQILSFIQDPKMQNEFKTAFILERFSLFLCNQLSKQGLYLRDVVFLKKVAAAVYASSFIFIKLILSGCEVSKYKPEIEELQNRKITLNEENVAENNAKLWRMLESETAGLEPALSGCLSKLREFETEFSCDEACQYLLDVFLSLGECEAEAKRYPERVRNRNRTAETRHLIFEP